MKQTLNYNIHNILKLQIVREKRRDLVKDLNLPFSYFETEEELDNPDIIFNIGKFEPSNKNCYVIDHKYHIKDNYFYCKDSEGRIRWEEEIFGFENGDTIVNFKSNIFGLPSILIPDFLPQNLLLRPLIEYKLAEKGYFLIHSSGVSKNGRAYLFAGTGGSFKTSIVMDLIRKAGFDFMADDRIILHKSKVLCFPMHFLTFNFRIKNLPNEDFRNILDRIRLIKYLRSNQSSSCNVPLSEDSALNSFFILEKSNRNNSVERHIIPLKNVVDKLAANNKIEMIKSPMMMGMDFGRYFDYMLAYSFVFPNSQVATYWDDFRDGLERILKNVSMYRVKMPESYNLDTSNRVYECLEGAI